jgi:hypothetical protein
VSLQVNCVSRVSALEALSQAARRLRNYMRRDSAFKVPKYSLNDPSGLLEVLDEVDPLY